MPHLLKFKFHALATVYLGIQMNLHFIAGFTWIGGEKIQRQLYDDHSPTTRRFLQDEPNNNDDRLWMSEGFLMSSFTDGLKNNQKAQHILRQGLTRAMLQQAIAETELALADSVRASPCNGPNVQWLEQLEDLDQGKLPLRQRRGNQTTEPLLPLRILFLPTAMYAQRLDSSQTLGKQRQRARADAKQRRDDIFEMIANLGIDNVEIHGITVDLADGSVKHPEVWSRQATTGIAGTTIKRKPLATTVPKNSREAIIHWKPHLIYIPGGNTFWLHYCMRGWHDELRSALTSGETFFCGASAGAIVAGNMVATALWKGWDDVRVVPEPVDWQLHNHQTAGLSLLGPHYSCFPHYDATWENTLVEKTHALRENIDPVHNIIPIANDQVVHVVGSKQSIQIISQL
jgi:peptidase E